MSHICSQAHYSHCCMLHLECTAVTGVCSKRTPLITVMHHSLYFIHFFLVGIFIFFFWVGIFGQWAGLTGWAKSFVIYSPVSSRIVQKEPKLKTLGYPLPWEEGERNTPGGSLVLQLVYHPHPVHGVPKSTLSEDFS